MSDPPKTIVPEGTKVFVRDDHYEWLPAELAQPIEEGDSTASVYITLPDDWDRHTVSPRQPSLRRGSIVEETGKVARRVKLADYPGGELPLQNVDAKTGRTLGKSDMADLPHLHEAAILYNLKDRHKKNIPYTRVGDIVVAVNPFQWIDGLYSDRKRHFYAHKLVWNAEKEDYSNRQDILEGYFDRLDHDPHVYETACNSYLGLVLDKRDQAILVSGESGAGKTESVKLVMAHLATIENTRDQATVDGNDLRTEIVSKIAESNPLFEAFGNAKTARNDNSSRFGKLTKLHFHIPPGAEQVTIRGEKVPFPVLAGSSFETYLLEKSRVAVHDEGERSYHFFYQLLAAPNEDKKQYWDGLDGSSGESFRYIGVSESLEHQSDAEDWEETKVALDMFGFKGGKLRALVRAVCVVLQLGNLTFALDPSGEDGSIISSVEELEKLSTLVGIPAEDLVAALTTRPLKTYGEEIVVRLDPAAAKEGCDALAKEIYAQVFQVLVGSINEAMVPPSGVMDSLGMHSISILDMFGFESFEVNRFEQLCINYANERIQHKYASDTFLQLKDEYEAEEIEIYDFSAVDNSEVLSLVEGRTGLINVLNEECIRPNGNDESFVYKIKTIHKETECLVDNRLHSSCEFSIRHFAGVVTYNSSGFVARNTDKLPSNVLSCIASSNNELISERLQALASEVIIAQSNIRALSRKRAAMTITTKFKKRLTTLMADIKNCRTRYIRCIKPNTIKEPLVLEHQMTMRQLASAGLVTAITVSRETFPDNLPYEVVYDRFHILLPLESKSDSRSVREKARILLEYKLQGREKLVGGHVIAPFACGKTKVFFRSGSLEILESERLGLYSAKASVLQRWVRKFLAEKRYRAFENTAIILQSKWRGKMSRKMYLQKLGAAMVIQCWGRRRLASSEAIRLRHLKAAIVIQSLWRMLRPKEELQQSKNAVKVIQRFAKSIINRYSVKAAVYEVVEEAQMDRKLKILQGKLDNPLSDDKDDLLKESSLMIEYLSRQLYKQRGRVSDLKADLEKKEKENMKKERHSLTVKAALAANKLEVSKLRTTSSRLELNLAENKASKANMRVMLKSMQSEHKSAATKQLKEQNAMKVAYMNEIAVLKEEIRSNARKHAAEILDLKREISQKEANHKTEMQSLREEMQRAEESQSEDLSKVLNALGSAHEESAKLSDEEVVRLQQDIEDLKRTSDAKMDSLKVMLCKKCFKLYDRELEDYRSGASIDSDRSLLSRSIGSRNVKGSKSSSRTFFVKKHKKHRNG